MPYFGNIGWGLGAWGIASADAQTSAEPDASASSGHEHGESVGTAGPHHIFSVSEFRRALHFAESPGKVSTAHVRAYIQTFAVPEKEHQFTVPVPSIVLKAKSWVEAISVSPKDIFSGIFDLSAFILVIPFFSDTDDITGSIRAFSFKDLPAILSPTHLTDLIGSMTAVPPVDLSALFVSVPPNDIPASTTPVPGVNLGAIGGGHFPVDLPTLLGPVPPVNLPVFIRSGASGINDLSASLQQTGYISSIGSLIKVAQTDQHDLNTLIRVIATASKDITASVQPFNLSDLAAVIGTQRVYEIRSIINGIKAGIKDLYVSIRRSDSDQSDISVTPIKSVVSTHTSDKKPNLGKVSNTFFNNRYIFGTHGAGMFFLTLEPVYGIFPDLHAEIFARGLTRFNIPAYLRVAQGSVYDITSSFVSVPPFININKLTLQLIPLLNIIGDLNQVGVISPIRANITPVNATSTGTSDDAGFITTAFSYRFYLGTNKGLFIPPQVIPEVRISTYRNTHLRPDLHATISGWNEINLGATISDYPFLALGGQLNVLDISKLNHISATISPFNTTDFFAQLNVSGQFEHISASLGIVGGTSLIGGVLIPYVNPLSVDVVQVSIKPFVNLGAIINYGSLVRCSPTSMVTSLGGYVKSVVAGTDDTASNLGADLNVLRMEQDIYAVIVGKRITRLQVLNLTFRSKIRQSSPIRGSITPLYKVFSDFVATIKGIPHESSLAATLSVVRYAPHDVDFTAKERVVNLKTDDTRDVLISFRSQVNTYVYDDVVDSVFSTDRGTWAIDLRTLIRDESFFDRAPKNKAITLDGLVEFYSLDEAIRNAIVVLCEQNKNSIGASITTSGYIQSLGANVGVYSEDMIKSLPSKLVSVSNIPDISASINLVPGAFSSYAISRGSLSARHMDYASLFSIIEGNIINDLTASITAV